jgi:outer membrane protein
MSFHFRVLAVLVCSGLACTAAQAQNSSIKFGVARYDTNAKTNGVTGIGIPAGADAETSDATTLLLVYEYEVMPNIGIELVLGLPPKIKARATGSVAFLGEVLAARSIGPTALVNYHFGTAGDTWRPYVGVGINYTRFSNISTPYGWDVSLSDSVGPAAHVGMDYAINMQWGAYASVAVAKVKSDLVATGAAVLQTTIDFRPVVYSVGLSYRF